MREAGVGPRHPCADHLEVQEPAVGIGEEYVPETTVVLVGLLRVRLHPDDLPEAEGGEERRGFVGQVLLPERRMASLGCVDADQADRGGLPGDADDQGVAVHHLLDGPRLRPRGRQGERHQEEKKNGKGSKPLALPKAQRGTFLICRGMQGKSVPHHYFSASGWISTLYCFRRPSRNASTMAVFLRSVIPFMNSAF